MNVLLINPSYYVSYGGAKGSVVEPFWPTLGLASIAGAALARGHRVEILDLSWRPYSPALIREKIHQFQPDIVGVTCTTPLMNQVRDISVLAKDISRNIRVVASGPHPTALPRESLLESQLDAVFVGEADFTFGDLCDGAPLETIPGVCYRDGETIRCTPRPAPVLDLDALPMPAWHLYRSADYRRISRLLARRPPVAMIEFSRGCVYRCEFCASRLTMGMGLRRKSPERCVEEVRRLHELGYREFMLADDIFTSHRAWALEVCRAIEKSGVRMSWTCTNGIRVESADPELFTAMRKAGCYRVSFGLESGNEAVLEQCGKGGAASLARAVEAVKTARKCGLDACGFFLLGLSADTEETMRDTIEFARRLPLDMVKFAFAIAFPGTPMFYRYVRRGLVKTFDWDRYFIYTDQALFAHPHLDFPAIQRALNRAYRRAVLFNPRFVARRLLRGIRTGEILWDLGYALRFYALPASAANNAPQYDYYARDRWPVWDFSRNPPQPAPHPVIARDGKTRFETLSPKKSMPPP